MIYYKKLNLVLLLLLFLATNNVIWAQNDSMQIYREMDLRKVGVAFYSYAKADKFNFEVVVLGGVKQPGIYLLPEGTTVLELVAISGGVTDESILDNFKLIRAKTKNPELKADTVIVISFKDFFDKDKIGSISKQNPLLRPGDIITFAIKPDKDFWDYAGKISTVIILPLLTITTLVLQVMSYNK
ncbi:MAG: SLBB domain-containing protein [Ignavibacteriae bacterium]|nr:SLBB domain-containing protein [Ignavibacteriota bacterium]